jgi:hypothetical protein
MRRLLPIWARFTQLFAKLISVFEIITHIFIRVCCGHPEQQLQFGQVMYDKSLPCTELQL